MSGNPNDQSALEHEEDHERADRIMRDILESSHTRQSISPSGELYRMVGRYSRHNLPSLRNRSPHRMSAEQDAGRRRRSQLGTGDSPLFVLPLSNPAIPTPRERLNSRMARRLRTRYMTQQGQRAVPSFSVPEPTAADSLLELQNAGRQLDQASSNLRAHLDLPLPDLQYNPVASSSSFEHTTDPDESSHARRVKRRKVETDSVESKFTGFHYGKYGQKEAGKLKMEIVSCDGGIYQEGPYTADNVLRTDDTVYCTKSNRCNLVLRHQGATVFSLTELIIKAPHIGYSAPVQEGMVFVSMTSDDLLTRTARYQIQYSPPRNRTSNTERQPGELPSIMSIRHNRNDSAQTRAARLWDIGLQDEECDFRTAQIPPDFTTSALPFQVTTECSDSEEDDPNRDPLRPNNRNLYEPSDSSEDEPTYHQENYLMNEIQDYRNFHPSALRRRETASNITLAEAAEASQLATQEAVRAVGGELMVPHAKFFIERDKSKCTVRFDPPVSGRFILLKMWSPHQNPLENIDVQSVVAKGFAGPRFIPDVTLR